MLANVNENANHNMISYTPYRNSNHTYTPSTSSVIVRNNSTYRSAIPEVYFNNRTSTIPTIPAIKLDCNVEPKQVKPLNFPRSSSGQLKTLTDTVPEPSQMLANQYVRYGPCQPYRQPPNQMDTATYPTVMAQRDLDTPPPAHLNAMMTSVLPKITPAVVSLGDFQTEPLDLVMVANNVHSFGSDPPETNVPLQLNTFNNDAKPNLQMTANNCDKIICLKTEQRDNQELFLPVNNIGLSIIRVTTSSTVIATTLSYTSPTVMSSVFPSDTLAINSTNSSDFPTNLTSAIPITISAHVQPPPTISKAKPLNISTTVSPAVSTANQSNISITVSKVISSDVSTVSPMTTSTTIPTTVILKTVPSTIVSTKTTTTTSNINRTASPPTPPPVLIPATYTETSYGVKTHHHKLKKAWLQRHAWAEDLKEAGVSIDQNRSRSFSQMDDTPPVLQCENIPKRKKSKITHENNVRAKIPSEISSCDSDAEQRSLISTVEKPRKRKTQTAETVENKSTTESDKELDSNVEKKVPPIKIPKKRGRKPKIVVVNADLLSKKVKINGEVIRRFFQSGPCLNLGPRLSNCRECRIYLIRSKKEATSPDDVENIFCRYYAFRMLYINSSGQLMDGGFPDPYDDVTVVRE